MITAIEIENFKGISDRVRIELRPITLLFGPSSGGKSTILHAIQYAQEIFARHNLDVEKTESGGGLVDLGGFQNLVHQRDLRRPVRLRFESNVARGDWDLSPVTAVGPEYATVHLSEEHRPRLASQLRLTSIELEVAWSELRGEPYVSRYAVGINGQFRTPRHIIAMMVKLVYSEVKDREELTWTVGDPACGTAGFLVGAMQYLVEKYTSEAGKIEEGGNGEKAFTYTGDGLAREEREHLRNEMFFGFDFDATMLRIATMNLLLHNANRTN